MNLIYFILATIIYFAISTASSLKIYLGLKGLEKLNQQAVSKTARLLTYQKITSIWLGSVIFWLMISIIVFGNSNYVSQNILGFVVAFFVVLFFVYYLTTYRKRTIELTEDIKQIDQKAGDIVEFTSGFSKNTGTEMLKLFIILFFGIALILALIFILTKHNLI